MTSGYLAHSRWFVGNAEPADPTIVGTADSAHNAGALPGVSRIWAPQAYRDPGINLFLRGYSYGQTAWYPADFVVTWNADSSLGRVRLHAPQPAAVRAERRDGVGLHQSASVRRRGTTTPELEDGTGSPSVAAVGYHHLYGTQPTCFPDWWAITCAELEQKAQVEPLDFNFDGVRGRLGDGHDGERRSVLHGDERWTAAGGRYQWRLRAVTGTETSEVPRRRCSR